MATVETAATTVAAPIPARMRLRVLTAACLPRHRGRSEQRARSARDRVGRADMEEVRKGNVQPNTTAQTILCLQADYSLPGIRAFIDLSQTRRVFARETAGLLWQGG